MQVKITKSILSVLLCCSFAISALSQTTQSINVIFNGINKNSKSYQVIVDGVSYFWNKNYTNVNGNQNTLIVENIQPGNHLVKIYNLKSIPKSKKAPKKIFVLSQNLRVRANYDVNIKISTSGPIQISETATSVPVQSNIKIPATDAQFNTLMQSVRSKWSQALKGETLSEAFNNPNNYFTTSQIKQLLSLITSEGDRLDLAKLSYRSVTDSSNFIQLSDLFKIPANKIELNDFLRSKGWNNINDQAFGKTPMTDAKFSTLLQTVRSKWSQALKGETESEAFNNPNNFFSTSQIRQLLILMSAENDQLDLAKLSYRAVTDTANFIQLNDLFKTPANKNDFNDFLRSKGWNVSNQQYGVKTPMADLKYNELIQTVRNKWSEDLKGQTESEAFNNPDYYFSTSQIRDLLLLMTNENDRLDLAILSYRSVTDSANFTRLYDLFKTQANRDELSNFLRSKGWNITNDQVVNPAAKTPMSSADFDKLLSNVRVNLIQFLKVNYETDVFNNPNYFFTTAQIRELLLLINDEKNRLDLAKLSYKTVTDPANFLQLTNLLSSRASRDELTNYVKNFRQ
jgi:hypothetical protein